MIDVQQVRPGQRFSHLVAMHVLPEISPGTWWLCQCDCGGERRVRQPMLVSGKVKICGKDCPLHTNNQGLPTPEEIAERAAEIRRMNLARYRETGNPYRENYEGPTSRYHTRASTSLVRYYAQSSLSEKNRGVAE